MWKKYYREIIETSFYLVGIILALIYLFKD